MTVRIYDVGRYPFASKLQGIFLFNQSLEAIHLLDVSSSQVTFENDTATIYQKTFYSSDKYTEFRNMYYNFVKHEIGPLFPGESSLVVQKDPQLRVCCPGNTALGLKVSDTGEKIGMHCDADYNHPPQERNFIIAVTEMWETNSVFVESLPNKGDFEPMRLHWNHYIEFYGNRCRHYNMTNKTGQSRVSLDFRVIPYSEYDPTYEKESIHGKRAFKLGDYFIELPVNEIKS